MNSTKILSHTATALGLAVAAVALSGGPASATDDVDLYRFAAPPTSTTASGGVVLGMGDGSVRFVAEGSTTDTDLSDPGAGDSDADGRVVLTNSNTYGGTTTATAEDPDQEPRASDLWYEPGIDGEEEFSAGGGGGGSCWDWTDAETGETVTECH